MKEMEGSFYRDGDVSPADEYRMRKSNPTHYRRWLAQKELEEANEDFLERERRRQYEESMRKIVGEDDRHIGPP